jgi:CobQ-like glutamine amidotransferase family enzyme
MIVARAPGRLVIVHLFPELLNLYGDRGNVVTLARRAQWRGLEVDVRAVDADETGGLASADVIFIGGGQDRQQIAVARALERVSRQLRDAVAGGAALVAVCGGYQNVGHRYRSEHVGDLAGPGLLDVWTETPPGATRLVGGVVVALEPASQVAATGQASAAAAGFRGQEDTIVGFENHSGRTILGPGVRPLGRVRVGHGNTGDDGIEGAIALPGDGGLAGLRIGTYLHGPLLPRNPHLADFILGCALARRGVTGLHALPDDPEWAAHAAFARSNASAAMSSASSALQVKTRTQR